MTEYERFKRKYPFLMRWEELKLSIREMYWRVRSWILGVVK